MDKTTWLMYACAAIWAGFGIYLFILGQRQKKLEQRLRMAELMLEEQGAELE